MRIGRAKTSARPFLRAIGMAAMRLVIAVMRKSSAVLETPTFGRNIILNGAVGSPALLFESTAMLVIRTAARIFILPLKLATAPAGTRWDRAQRFEAANQRFRSARE